MTMDQAAGCTRSEAGPVIEVARQQPGVSARTGKGEPRSLVAWTIRCRRPSPSGGVVVNRAPTSLSAAITEVELKFSEENFMAPGTAECLQWIAQRQRATTGFQVR